MEEQEAPSIKSSNEPSYISTFQVFAVVELAAFVFGFSPCTSSTSL
jgi:hypothetical protein